MRETLIICTILLFFSVGSTSVHAATVDLTVSPSNKTVDVGDSFSLQIWAEAVDFETGDYWDWVGLGLEFNPAYLQLDDIRVNWSKFIERIPAPPGGGNNNHDPEAGYATINLQAIDDIISDVRIATLDFKALASVEQTQVNIADFFRDGDTATKIFQFDWPDDIYYNLGGDLSFTPGVENPIGNRGFGNVTIPEPAGIVLLCLGGLGLLSKRKHT